MASKNNTDAVETPEQSAAVYTKQRLLTLGKYRSRRDLLSVLLEDGRMYAFEDVDKMIDQFMKGAK